MRWRYPDDFFLREIPTFSLRCRLCALAPHQPVRFVHGESLPLLGSRDASRSGYLLPRLRQDSDLTLQRLPRVEFFASDRFLDRHLKLGLISEFDDFVRKQGFDGPRIDINPRIEAPFRWRST
jgi:hypothetical protein